jgi:hypothetical protein
MRDMSYRDKIESKGTDSLTVDALKTIARTIDVPILVTQMILTAIWESIRGQRHTIQPRRPDIPRTPYEHTFDHQSMMLSELAKRNAELARRKNLS